MARQNNDNNNEENPWIAVDDHNYRFQGEEVKEFFSIRAWCYEVVLFFNRYTGEVKVFTAIAAKRLGIKTILDQLNSSEK